MSNLYARAVFFTGDAEESLRFYTERLGFNVDWKFDEEGKTFVFQVSLLGFEVILNQTHDESIGRAGHGRVFIGLEDEQCEPVRKHFVERGVKGERVDWGRPTLVISDTDGNEIFFWFAGDDLTGLV
jgi:catechol 2,3-dioxygenase-like lactoylglutathione lyase family enzyme